MTLILGLMTRRYLLLVSDRRLVYTRGGGSYRFRDDDDDDHTKVAILGTSSFFGYTGLAKIDGKESHLWFTDAMKPFVDSGKVMEGLHEACTKLTHAFKQPSIRLLPEEVRRHAFMGLGFKVQHSTGRVFAAAYVVTNFHDRRGVEYEVARDEFILRDLSLNPRASLALIGVGCTPSEPGRRTTLVRYLRRRVFLREPIRAAHLLAHEIRRVAALGGPNGLVGKGLLVCCLPVHYALNGGEMSESFDMHALSLVHVPPSGTGNRRMIIPPHASSRWPAVMPELQLETPWPASGLDPQAEWRRELPLPTDSFDRYLP